jgi:fatty-acyl-CoA synthase
MTGMLPPPPRHWPRGLPRDVRVPDATYMHYLDTAALRYPDKPAVIYGGGVLTYAAFQQRVTAMAGFLQRTLGVQPGDRVLLISQNCPQWVVAFYAILRAQAAVVPVNPMSTAGEIAGYQQDSGATVAFVAQEFLANVVPCLEDHGGGLQHAVVHAYSDVLPSQGADPDLPEVVTAPRAPLNHARLHAFEDVLALGLQPMPYQGQPEDLAVLPYTSGTTGHPKGCMHSHRSLVAANVTSQQWRSLHADVTVLCVAPLFHMLGLQNAMNMPLTLGATVVMMPRWNAVVAARLMERYRVTAWAAPPAMVIDFFAHPDAATRDLSSLSLLSGGGAAMPEAIAKLLFERFGLSYNEAYGLSETASFLLANPVHRGKRQCLGVVTPGVDARIIDPETLQEVAQGEVGELVTRGPQVMSGYWRNDAANATAFIELDGQRFFRTGDLAMQDEEGYFFMKDRLKRMINVSGYKVWPAEVENVMYRHPAIHEACIVGVPDAQRGERVVGLVVLKPEHRGLLSEQALIDWGRDNMAVYKAPRAIRFLDSLPKSGAGKILWRELQDQERASATQTGASA